MLLNITLFLLFPKQQILDSSKPKDFPDDNLMKTAESSTES